MEERYILLVEDNPDDVKLTTKAFQKCGIAHRLDVASDGVEALEYLSGTGKFEGRDPNDLPAVILLDLKMPRINGIELLQKIRADARTKLIPVVVLTNSNEDRDKLESYGLGANSYVRKPVTYARFMEAVQQLGLTWLLINSPP